MRSHAKCLIDPKCRSKPAKDGLICLWDSRGARRPTDPSKTATRITTHVRFQGDANRAALREAIWHPIGTERAVIRQDKEARAVLNARPF